MEFTKQFAEAAQNAVLRKIEADQWESLPWLAKLVRKVASAPFTPPFDTCCDMQEIDLGDWNPTPKDEDLTPVDICGCPFGKCTCKRLDKAAKDPGGEPAVLEEFDGEDDSFESNSFSHVEGYDWRIIVSDRTKNHRNSWTENFKRPPSQDEFEYQYRHFHARTHHVHVNQWVNGEWITITGDYVPHWNKEKPKETFTTSDEWPEGKAFRVKFWDQRVNDYNYIYFDRKPGGIVLNKYHSAKCFAVVQARPEGV